jgi:hypothetical protein
MQPLIRYDTGDIVRRVENGCHPAFTFEFVGKAKNCISWRPYRKAEWLVLSAVLHEVLDPIPDFKRVEQFRGVSSTSDASVGSLPIYTLTKSEPGPGPLLITLTAELRYAPHFYPERTTELKNIIGRGLAETHEILAARIAEGAVDFQVVFAAPGALGGVHVLKI